MKFYNLRATTMEEELKLEEAREENQTQAAVEAAEKKEKSLRKTI